MPFDSESGEYVAQNVDWSGEGVSFDYSNDNTPNPVFFPAPAPAPAPVLYSPLPPAPSLSPALPSAPPASLTAIEQTDFERENIENYIPRFSVRESFESQETQTFEAGTGEENGSNWWWLAALAAALVISS